ncbi:MAG: polymerase sigma factor, sigma-70 family [Acidobacteria bacterium]|jgi:RNA polymerase sigma-70 factor (ECF subfamily)|nr:polymerase sigma factor, sigma-70 family [Acidobacteriota bacterium]
MLTNLKDEQLVELAISENPEAFGEIVKRWDRKIFALCYGMLGSEADARDATQESFIAAYRNLPKFRGDAKLSSWLHRIAVNQCLTLIRRAKNRSEDYLNEDESAEDKTFVAPANLSPSRATEKNERLTLVRQAVQSLPNELREIIVMKEFEEMTFQQISDTLELPLSTVKSRLYAALKQLRGKLERMPIEVI